MEGESEPCGPGWHRGPGSGSHSQGGRRSLAASKGPHLCAMSAERAGLLRGKIMWPDSMPGPLPGGARAPCEDCRPLLTAPCVKENGTQAVS